MSIPQKFSDELDIEFLQPLDHGGHSFVYQVRVDESHVPSVLKIFRFALPPDSSAAVKYNLKANAPSSSSSSVAATANTDVKSNSSSASNGNNDQSGNVNSTSGIDTSNGTTHSDPAITGGRQMGSPHSYFDAEFEAYARLLRFSQTPVVAENGCHHPDDDNNKEDQDHDDQQTNMSNMSNSNSGHKQTQPLPPWPICHAAVTISSALEERLRAGKLLIYNPVSARHRYRKYTDTFPLLLKALLLSYIPTTRLGRLQQLTNPQIAHLIPNDIKRGIRMMHECGVLHNDIKPRNLMIDGQTGTVTWIDFSNAQTREVGEDDVAWIRRVRNEDEVVDKMVKRWVGG